MKSTYHIIIACLLIGIVYLAAQAEFLQYYELYKKPFGRVDVDNYLDTIYGKASKTFDSKLAHTLIYVIGSISKQYNAVEIVFTFLIPLVSCIAMTGTVFLFILYFTRDSELSLLGLIFYIFGTFSMQAFMVSSYWAQLFATIGLLLFIIFFEEYLKNNKRLCLIICIACATYMALAHLKFVGAIPLYILSRMIVKKNFKIVAGIFIMLLIGWYMFPSILVSSYPVVVSVGYVVGKFLFPAFWVVVAAYVIFWRKELSDTEWTFFVFIVLVAVLSSFSALWRPLISVLPILIYFVVKFFGEFRNEGKKQNKSIYYYSMIAVTLLCLSVYFYETTSYSLSSMVGEMVPGVFNTTYRDMDPGPLLHMFGGTTSDIDKFNVTQSPPLHRVDGFVSITGHAVETDVIINGSQ